MTDKIIAEPADFTHGKAYLRELLFYMVEDFLERGGRIQVCRPCFAMGCEIRPVVRQAIRGGK